MRTKNVKISIEIPVPVNNTDENGVVYLNRSFEEACKEASGQPIEIFNPDGSSSVVGVASDIKYIKDSINGGCICINGMLFHGGTREQVSIDNGTVTNVRLIGFGITI